MIALFAALALAGTPAPDPMATLALYAGTWKTEIETLDTAWSKPGKSGFTLRNDCLRQGVFLACSQTVDGEQKAMVVWAYDPASRSYVSYPIPVGGGPASHSGFLVEGDTVSFPWDQPKDGAVVHYRIVNRFVDHDTIDFRQEVSTDGKSWTLTGRGVEHRQALPGR